MRCAYLDLDQHPDGERLRRSGCDAVAFDIRQGDLSLDYFHEVQREGFAPLVYADGEWNPALSARQFADQTSARLEQLAPGTPPTFPSVVLDIERHDVPWILAALTRWRQHRPARATFWVLESMQGGLFSPTDVAAIMHLGVGVGPSLYRGDMTPLDPHDVWANLTSAGFPLTALVGLWPADHLPGAWSGFAFPQGRLP